MSDNLNNFQIITGKEYIDAYSLRGLLLSDLSGVQNGDSLVWNASIKKWITGPNTNYIQVGGTIPYRSLYIGDTYTSNQKASSLAIGNYAGSLNQGISSIAFGERAAESNQGTYAIAIGYQAGNTIQGVSSIAIGNQAGVSSQHDNTIILNASGTPLNSDRNNALYVNPIRNDDTLSNALYYNTTTKEIVYSSKSNTISSGTNYGDYLYWNSNTTTWAVGSSKINIGSQAGQNNQGTNSVALGNQAGNANQGVSSIAIGDNSGNLNQGTYAISLGYQAGNSTQGNYAIAIGNQAGKSSQGTNSIAIGNKAGATTCNDNTIILNASGSVLNTDGNSRFFVDPIRSGGTGNILLYNSTSKEVSYGGDVNMQNLTLYGNILPNGTRDIGSTTQIWNNIYGTNIVNTIAQRAGGSTIPFMISTEVGTTSGQNILWQHTTNEVTPKNFQFLIETKDINTNFERMVISAYRESFKRIHFSSNICVGLGVDYASTQASGAIDCSGDMIVRGNVGIGTSSPTSLVDMTSTSNPVLTLAQTTYTNIPSTDTVISKISMQNDKNNGNKECEIQAFVRGGTAYSTPSIAFSTRNKNIMDVILGSGTNDTIATSTDGGLTWSGRGKGVLPTDGRGAVYGNRWVAVGSGTSRIAWSDDGISWTSVSNSTSIFLTRGFCVGWNGSKYIAGGQGGNMLAYSSDGKIWTGLTASFTARLDDGVSKAATGNVMTVTAVSSGIITVGMLVNINGVKTITAKGTGTGGIGTYILSATGNSTETSGISGYPGFNNSCQAIAWSPTLSLWVAGGNGVNSLIYSSDGITWSLCNVTSNLVYFVGSGFAWGLDRFVVVGQTYVGNPLIGYSTNGVTWNNVINSPTIFTKGNGVAWNGTRFVAVGQGNGTIAYSTNSTGVDWVTTPNNSGVFEAGGLAYLSNGSKWVGVSGGNNKIGYSADTTGYYWTGLGNIIFSQGNSLAWISSLNKWVSVGSGTNTLAYSTNNSGTTWTGLGNLATFTGVIDNGAGTGSIAGTVLTVSNITAGQTITVGMTISASGVASGTRILSLGTGTGGNGTYNITGSNQAVTSRTMVAGIFLTSGNGLASNSSRFVAVGEGTNSLAYSDDAITWNGLGTTLFSTRGNKVAWNGTNFVAVGEGNNTIAYSSDGASWTGLTTTVFSTKGLSVVWGGGSVNRFVAVGETNNSIAYSSNGISWTSVTNSTNIFTTGNSVAWSGSIFVAAGSGSNHTLAYSSDGINWTGLGKTIFSTQGTNVSWNGVKFVATGTGGNTVAFSFDGIIWSLNIFTTSGNGISWNGKRFIATGSGGNILASSTDGLTWSPITSSVFTAGYGVASSGVLTQKMVITESGNVGIGISTPSSILDVNGTTTLRGDILPDFTSNYRNIGNISYNFNNLYINNVRSSGSLIRFSTGSNDIERMKIDNNVNIGVGATLQDAYSIPFKKDTSIIESNKTIQNVSLSSTPILRNNSVSFRQVCMSGSGEIQYAISVSGTEPSLSVTQLWKSSDYGVSWATSGSATGGTTYVQSMCCSKDGKYVYFPLSNVSANSLQRSSDFGATITTISNPLSTQSSAGNWVSCSDDGKIIYMIGDSCFTSSYDYGINFTPKTSIIVSGTNTSFSGWELRGVFCSSDGRYVILLKGASTGTVYISSDYGQNWINPKDITDRGTKNYRACAMSSNGQYMIVGTEIVSNNMISTNYGVSWSLISGSIIANSICCSSDFKYIVMVDITSTTRKLYYSSDYGQTFSDQTDASISANYNSLSCSTDFRYFSYILNNSINVRNNSVILPNVEIRGNIIPDLDSTYNLGSLSKIYSNAYIKTLTLKNGNSIDTYTNNQLLLNWAPSINGYSHAIKSRHSQTQISGNGIDFYLWQPGDNIAGVGSKQAMSITGTGLGIGTSSPTSLLDVTSTSNPTLTLAQTNLTYLPSSETVVSKISMQNDKNYGYKDCEIQALVRGGSLYSTPSISFATRSTPAMVIAGGTSVTNSIATSVDAGLNWTGRTITNFTSGNGFAWGNKWVGVGTGTFTIVNSIDGISWNTVSNSKTDIFTQYGNCVAWSTSLNLFVAGGYSGGSGKTLAYSSDGLTWTSISPSLSNECCAIVWSGTRWVAVGGNSTSVSSPTIIYSSDGITWQNASSGGDTSTGVVSFQGRGVAWNNSNLFVVVGIGSTNTYPIGYSSDGISWSPALTSKLIFSTQGNAVAWSPTLSRFVAVGSGTNTIAYSSNGIDWVATPNNSYIFEAGGFSYFFGNSIWAGVSGGTNKIGYSSTSPFGIWTAVSNSSTLFTSRGNGIAYLANGINRWAAVGSGGNTVAVSSDSSASSWSLVGSQPFSISGNCVTVSGTRLVAVGEGTTTIAYSDNVTTWNKLTATFQGTITGTTLNVSFLSGTLTIGMIISGGSVSAGTIITQQNSGVTGMGGLYTVNNSQNVGPISMTATAGFSTRGNSASWNGTRFVAVGEGTNTVAYSSDGLTWTGLSTTVFLTKGSSVVWGGGSVNRFVAVGSGTNSIAYSSDGISWSGLGTSIFTTGNSVDWNGTRFVAAGSGSNTVAYSNDGISWVGFSTSLFTTQGSTVAWNGIKFIVTGTGGNTIVYSTDGLTWSTNIFSTSGNGVTWNGTSFSATGEGGNIFASSSDGIVWSGRGGGTIFTKGSGVGSGYSTGSLTSRMLVTDSGNLEIRGNILPDLTANNRDVGSSTSNFNAGYFRRIITNSTGQVSIGDGASISGTSSISIGNNSGGGEFSINIGRGANQNSANSSVCLGFASGQNINGGSTVAIGHQAGAANLKSNAVAIGAASAFNGLGSGAVAIGNNACYSSSTNTGAVSVGINAGYQSQGIYSIAIGSGAGYLNQPANSIILNSSGSNFSPSTASAFYVNPIRSGGPGNIIVYDSSSKEVQYGGKASCDGLTLFNNINPDTTGTRDIGSSSLLFNNGYYKKMNIATGSSGNGALKIAVGTDNANEQNWIGFGSPGASFFGDANDRVRIGCFIEAGGAGNLFFTTGANGSLQTEKMRITSGGNIGINTNSPSTTLDINGVTTVRGNILPDTTSIRDIGSSSKMFNNLYCKVLNAPLATTINQNNQMFTSKLNTIVYNDNTRIRTSNIFVEINDYSRQRQTYTFGRNVKNRFIAVGSGTNSIAFSSDGLNWNGLGTSIFSSEGNGITWDGIKWVAVGQGTHSIAYSYNGLTWSGIGTSIFTVGNHIEYEDNIFVAMGSSTNTIAYSYDGISWIPVTNSTNIFSTAGYGCFSNGNVWVGVGAGSSFTLAYSLNNGVTWTGINNTIFSIAGRGVTWNGDIFVAVGEGSTYSIATSSDGISWSGLNNTVFTTRGNSIAWNGDIFVAVGEGTNTVAYSSDGLTWTGLSTTVFSAKGLGVVWNGNMFVATGASSTPTGIIAYSMNGINWKTTNSGLFSTQCNKIAFNSRRYNTINFPQNMTIAGGITGTATNTLAISYDNGSTWSGLGNSIFSTSANAFAWNGQMWVAVGEGTNTIAVSTPPLNNSFRGLGTSIFSTRGLCVVWGNNRWVAGGQGGNTIAYSYDGMNWIPASSPFGSLCSSICWTGTVFIAGGSGGGTSIAYSSDGITWTSAGAPFTNTCFGVAWNGTIAVAVGEGAGSIRYSTNRGLTWNLVSTTIFSARGYAVASNENMFVAVGEGTGTKVAYSYDGITWTNVVTSPFSTFGRGVCWTIDRWLAFGRLDNTIAYSFDGLNWTAVTNSTNIFTYGNCGANNAGIGSVNIVNPVIALGSGTNSISYSEDGLNWIPVGKNIFTTNGWAACWNGLRWVAVGSGTNTLATSLDGQNWTGLGTSIFSSKGVSVAWNGNLFVATGEGNNGIAYSNDGLSWTGIASSSTFSTGNAVAWGRDRFIAVGQILNKIMYSTSGTSWTGVTTSLFSSGWGVVWGKDKFVVVCENPNSIIYSDTTGTTLTAVTNSTTIFSSRGRGIAFNGNIFVAVGEGTANTLAYSSDGITWNALGKTIFSTGGYSVCWDGKKFIAGGIGTNTLAYSYDGITWYGLGTILFTQAFGIGSNPRVGTVIVDSQIALNSNSYGLTNNLDIYSNKFYNRSFTNFSATIKSENF